MLHFQQIINALREYSLLVELTGGESYLAQTFANAARTLQSTDESLWDLIEAKRLSSIRGIGKTVEAAILSLVNTGSFPELDEVRRLVPVGVYDLMQVQGLGPKKARVLWQSGGVESLDALEEAIRKGTLSKLPGIGEKTLAKFLEGIEFVRKHEGRYRRDIAYRDAEYLKIRLRNFLLESQIFFCGSMRRGNETVGDLDIILVAKEKDIAAVRHNVSQLSDISWRDTHSDIWSGRFTSGIEVEVSVCSPADAPHRLLIATGSKKHLEALASAAKQSGFALTDDGLKDSKGKLVSAADEADLYRALNLEPVPPPMREDETTLHALGRYTFPDTVTRNDIQGILHVHTKYSDGRSSLREMVEGMIELGGNYLGIADHSKVAAYAGGLTEMRVREQWKEIDQLNEEVAPFRILKGIECDILADGSMDFDDQFLSEFDFVVASIHSGFKMTEEAATKRLCRALENPHVDILGHPTGRLLLERDGYPVNHERIIECAAKHGKAIELNADPYRLDIDWRWIPQCIEAGVPVPIDPDSHSKNALTNFQFGLDVAAKAGLTVDNCPSAWEVNKLLSWLKRK